VIVAALAALWTGAAFGRLAYLQLFRYSEYYSRAQHQQRLIVEVGASRAEIFDRNMNPLAMSVPVDSAFAVPSEIADPDMVARLIGKVLDVPADEIATRIAGLAFLRVDRAQAASGKGGPHRRHEPARDLFSAGRRRFYPKRDLAAHVLGYVDIDEKGLGGIEYSLDDAFAASPANADPGRRAPPLVRQHRQGAGRRHSVVLTLDENIQYIAEKGTGAGDSGRRRRPARSSSRIRIRANCWPWRTGRRSIPMRQGKQSRIARGSRHELAVRAGLGFQNRDAFRGHRSGT
jgi:cell division protein FtsI/penicillin-binding protein 2